MTVREIWSGLDSPAAPRFNIGMETNYPSGQPEELPADRRPVLRAVALAYRRAKRAGLSERKSHEAALAEYRRVDPAAPFDRLEASGDVVWFIAAAINANIQRFWHGPDA